MAKSNHLPEGAQAIAGWGVFWACVAYTLPVYFVQIFFGIVTLVGFGIMAGVDHSWIFSAVDIASFGSVAEAGGVLWLFGAVGAMFCGLFTALMVYGVSSLRYLSLKPGGMWSLLILVFCTVALLCPVFNLFPVMWLWCLYVSLA